MIKSIFLMLLVAVGLSGCGGNPNVHYSNQLQGTAAVGKAIANGTVKIICASGDPLSSSTDGTGAWQVNFSGQTLPCAVRVAGGTINQVPNTVPYHAIATDFDTVNITPLTDLIVANLIGTSTPTTWFNGLTSAQLLSITLVQNKASLDNLRAAFELPPLTTSDPIRVRFNPNSGVVMDDILTAFSNAMNANSSFVYSNLLSLAGASKGAAFTTPVGFNALLTNEYVSTKSCSGAGVTFRPLLDPVYTMPNSTITFIQQSSLMAGQWGQASDNLSLAITLSSSGVLTTHASTPNSSAEIDDPSKSCQLVAANGPILPSCNSKGILFTQQTGRVCFTNTPMKVLKVSGGVIPYTSSGSLDGSLTFTPF